MYAQGQQQLLLALTTPVPLAFNILELALERSTPRSFGSVLKALLWVSSLIYTTTVRSIVQSHFATTFHPPGACKMFARNLRLVALCCLVWIAMAVASPTFIDRRQGPEQSASDVIPSPVRSIPSSAVLSNPFSSATASSAATASTTSTSGVKRHTMPIIAIIVPVIAVAIFLVCLLAWTITRKGGPPRNLEAINQQGPSSPASDTPQEPLSRGRRAWKQFCKAFSIEEHPTARARARAAAAHAQAQAQARGRARQRQHRREARLRRTDSGHSIRTVPQYKSEVSTGEVVLYKAEGDTTASSEALEMSMSRSSQGSEEVDLSSDTVVTLPAEEAAPAPRARSIPSVFRNSLRRSVNRSQNSSRQQQDDATSTSEARELQELSPTLERDEQQFVQVSLTQTPTDQTPLYDDLYPQYSPEDSREDLELQEPDDVLPPTRSSRVRDWFMGPVIRPNGHNVSLANVAQNEESTSSLPSSGSSRHRRFFSSGFNALTNATTPSAASTGEPNNRRTSSSASFDFGSRLHLSRSDAGRGESPSARRPSISAPLQDTLVRIAATGGSEGITPPLTREQARFMGSVESLGRYGIRIGGAAGQENPSLPIAPAVNEGVAPPPGYVSVDIPSSQDTTESSQPQAESTHPATSRISRPPPLLTTHERIERERLVDSSQMIEPLTGQGLGGMSNLTTRSSVLGSRRGSMPMSPASRGE